MKQALAYSGPLDFAAMRTLFGALSLFAVMLALRRPLRPPPLGATAVLGLLQTALFTGCTMAALVWGGAGKTAVLTYTMPFWALLLSRWFLGERVRRAQWPAVALAFAGLALIIGRPPELFAHRESMAAIPVIGVLSARIELGERPSFSETVGMVLIGTGLIALPVAGMSLRRRT